MVSEQMNVLVSDMDVVEQEEFDMIPSAVDKERVFLGEENLIELEEEMLLDFESANPRLQRADDGYWRMINNQPQGRTEEIPEKPEKAPRTGLMLVQESDIYYLSDINPRIYPSKENPAYSWYMGTHGANLIPSRDWDLQSALSRNEKASQTYVLHHPKYIRYDDNLAPDRRFEKMSGYLLNAKYKEDIEIIGYDDFDSWTVTIDGQELRVVSVVWYNGRYIVDSFGRFINQVRNMNKDKLCKFMTNKKLEPGHTMSDFVYSPIVHEDQYVYDEAESITSANKIVVNRLRDEQKNHLANASKYNAIEYKIGGIWTEC